MGLLEDILRFVTANVSHWGYPAIFLLMLLESACIPIPSEAIMVFAGFQVWQGELAFIPAVAAGTLGNLVGSWVAYWVGLFGGRPFLRRYGRYILLSQHKLKAADEFFDRYGESTVFFSRLLPVIRTFISLPAGIAEMGWSKFSIYTFLGSLPWCLLLAYLGIVLGVNWETAVRFIDELGWAIAFLCVLAVVVYLVREWRRRKAS